MSKILLALFIVSILASPLILLGLGVVATLPFFLLGAIGQLLGAPSGKPVRISSALFGLDQERNLRRTEPQSLAEALLTPSKHWRSAG